MAAAYLGHPEGITEFRKRTAQESMRLAVEFAVANHAHTIKKMELDLPNTTWMFRLHETDRGPNWEFGGDNTIPNLIIRITAYPVVKKTATGSQLYVWQAKKNKFIPDGPKRMSDTLVNGKPHYVATEPTQKAWASTNMNSFVANYVWRKRAQWDIHKKIANRAEAAFLSLASTEYDHTRIDPTL